MRNEAGRGYIKKRMKSPLNFSPWIQKPVD